MMVTVAVSGSASLVHRAAEFAAASGLVVLVGRRRHPLVTLAVVIVVFAAEAPVGGKAAIAFLAVMICAYSLGSCAAPRSLVAGLVLAVAFVVAGQYLAPQRGYSHVSADIVLVSIFVLVPAVFGGWMRTRAGLAARLRETVDLLRAGRDARLETAVAAERERVAAQLNRAAARGLDQARAHAAVAGLADVMQLEQISRTLLAELRGLVTELRDGGPGEETGQTPALTQLRAQVGRALAAAPAVTQRSRFTGWTLASARAVDAGLAVIALTLAVTFGVTQLTSGHPLPQAALAAGAALPVAVARRWPVASVTAVLVLTLAYTRLAAPADPQGGLVPIVISVIMPLIVAASCPARRAAAGLVLCLGGCVALAAASPGVPFAPAETAGSAAVAAGCWMAGRLLRSSAALIGANAGAAVREAEEQARQARQVLTAERIRLARDLHDATGHVLTVLVMQAAAARKVWHADPAKAAQHVRVLRSTLAGALSDLHPLILSLALDGTAADGTGGLCELIDRARLCGLDIDYRGDGDTTAGPAACRIVQEALTNAARHAPGAPVLVSLAQTIESVHIEIVNGPASLPPLVSHSGGAGIRGMTETAAASGGTLTAAPTTDGGFTVSAVLPSGASQ
jgi:signal transduction histidine kinase